MTAPVGSVVLVGGGPGDPDLLTVGAVRALQDADVVLYDRLAPYAVLDELAPQAELVDVGKRPGHHAIPQEEIERLLIERALAGARVVRFKGGDPFVFGRGGEEAAACHAAGVPVRVIPGVTSAISVPATAGIPVTHRSLSRLFTVVSGHAPLSAAEAEHLAGLGGTIIVLMGVSNLPSISAALMRHGMPQGTPVAIVERGFTAAQRTTVSDLAGIREAADAAGVHSPAVIVIGEVVRLVQERDPEAVALLADATARAGDAP
ncbi:uroporphyrinogen-III C-methyltransferase [Microbacterium capsulatum]|uniref:uroporphyrinogen-III C-methyltransferase n=1 Tax=Microbacterium capsulatum TaxID=3041921 RepID=A0ABU0XCJ0_9MICO|nr:uroporphyrinogen-III C-methyltransferase [Microbacterium sp. ASV81]MDQ4212830.1 uroporphyrinogen-III C-methyltransferase [Microbacterium sp. ASV81]